MDIQAYIQSGILEAYALGALPADEAAKVGALVSAHPGLHAELETLQDTIRSYAEASAKTPPHDLEARIWRTIEASRSISNDTSYTSTSVDSLRDRRDGARVMPLPVTEQPRASASFARAAVWAGLVGSLILNAVLWQQAHTARERLASLETRRVREATLFASQLSDRDQRLNAYALMKYLMADPDVSTVRLENLRPDAVRASIVFQNKRSGTAYLAVQKLPAPPPGKQYQLWVLESGSPKGIAMLHGGANATTLEDIQLVPVAVAQGEAFAISIENVGGALTPTADQIVMLGKVRA